MRVILCYVAIHSILDMKFLRNSTYAKVAYLLSKPMVSSAYGAAAYLIHAQLHRNLFRSRPVTVFAMGSIYMLLGVRVAHIHVRTIVASIRCNFQPNRCCPDTNYAQASCGKKRLVGTLQ